jgi:methanogen homoaconitase large subunit
MVVVGADSHTCTYGAFGAFSTGMGATDLAMVWATGKTWFMVPEAIRMEIEGELNPYIAPKDIILNIIGEIGIAGATYKTAEFCGPTIENMGVEGRATMCNMAIEMGAKNGIMEPNRDVIDYICKRTGKNESELNIVKSDSDATYSKEMHFDITDMDPQIACPNDVDNVKDISKVEGTPIDQCLIGSCTNGRLSDLKDACEILENQKICDDIRLLILPASKEIYKKAMHLGYIDTFIDAGAIICNPGCGPCLGGHMGVLSEGESCISTTNRNFKGRMGDPNSSVYLSNSKVVAASAITGVITNPKDL